MLQVEKNRSNQTSPRNKKGAGLFDMKFNSPSLANNQNSNAEYNSETNSMEDLQFGGGGDTLSPK